MTTSLVLFGVSTASLALLLVTFHIEAQKSVRFFENARHMLDMKAERFYTRAWHFQRSFARDTVRQTIHFILHIFLVGVRQSIKWIHDHFDTLIRVNKTMAKRSSNDVKKKGTLADVIAHKKSVALSDVEKKQYKESAIGTRL